MPDRVAWHWRSARQACLSTLLLPLILLWIGHRLLIRRRPITGFWQKWSGHGPRCRGRIMVHGVSMGEVSLMRPLLPILDDLAGAPCLLTTSTSTGWASLQKQFPEHPHRLLPFDLPWALTRFLDECRPRAVVLLECELWPGFISCCHARGIPVLLLNARLGAASFRGYARARSLIMPMLRHLSLGIAQTHCWAARLRALGAPPIRCGGSLKADMVRPASPEQISALRTRLQLDQRPILLLASTSAPEEETLLQSWITWGRNSWRCIICPRHPERGPELETLCQGHGLSSARSNSPNWQPARAELLIIDEIGQLAALYALADIAVVGGSLGSGRHGQNMLESAAAGCCTVVGWDTSNQPDAMALLRQRSAVIELSPESLSQALKQLADDPSRRQSLGQAAEQAWRDGKGAIHQSEQWLRQWWHELRN